MKWMFRLCINITLFLISVYSISQSSFELQIQMPNFEVPGDLIVDDEGNFIISASSLDASTNVYSGILIKLSASGEVSCKCDLLFPR